MKKPFHFTERTPDVRCLQCGRPLKNNLVARKEFKPTLCYKHWQDKVYADKNKQTGRRRW